VVRPRGDLLGSSRRSDCAARPRFSACQPACVTARASTIGTPSDAAHDGLRPENCNRAEKGREPTVEPNEQKAIGIAESCRFDTCRRSTLSGWRRTRISAASFALGLKSDVTMWRISRSNSIIRWQDYRVCALRLAESNFRHTQPRRQFYYQAPGADFLEFGVQSGTLLFEGRRNRNQYSGTAYVFSKTMRRVIIRRVRLGLTG
jgi:hypothetical protein